MIPEMGPNLMGMLNNPVVEDLTLVTDHGPVPPPAATAPQTASDHRPDDQSDNLPYQAPDGYVWRVNFPGGMIDAPHWQSMADIADTICDGELRVTGKSSIELRGADDANALLHQLQHVGLYQHPQHHHLRNYLSSPLSGRRAGSNDIRAVLRAVDRRIVESHELSSLPARSVLGFDDGSGDIVALKPDFAVVGCGNNDCEVLIGGEILLGRGDNPTTVDLLVDALHQWLPEINPLQRLTDQPHVIMQLRQWAEERAAGVLPHHSSLPELTASADAQMATQLIGWLEQPGSLVSLGMGLPFGQLQTATARLLAAIEKPTSITPWRGIVIHDLTEGEADAVLRALAPRGVLFDARSPWLTIGACTGSPGCQHANAHVREDAVYAASHNLLDATAVHFVGCPLRCDSPPWPHVEYLAYGDGDYETTEVSTAREI